ncbi:hypothetical protein ACFXK0_14040 [Nocardia sp. NPDC059177]|uniref:hypothetical protein n=1 Tax=Nocardia sp. NPDC059177 TaxID=3346759 RepID=UPI0036945FF0
MSSRPVIDAGPALNFLAIDRQRLLIGVLGPISTPETVEQEVLRKARTDARFKSAARHWSKLTPKWIQVLSDDWPELEPVVARIARMSMSQRRRQAKDLGELMVVAHALIRAEQGQNVTVVIDDQAGAALATAEAQLLDGRRANGEPVGKLVLAGTRTILEGAVGLGLVEGRAEMRSLYARLREVDDGLIPIDQTGLLSDQVWMSVARPG